MPMSKGSVYFDRQLDFFNIGSSRTVLIFSYFHRNPVAGIGDMCLHKNNNNKPETQIENYSGFETAIAMRKILTLPKIVYYKNEHPFRLPFLDIVRSTFWKVVQNKNILYIRNFQEFGKQPRNTERVTLK